jgi:hypothetical protein
MDKYILIFIYIFSYIFISFYYRHAGTGICNEARKRLKNPPTPLTLEERVEIHPSLALADPTVSRENR